MKSLTIEQLKALKVGDWVWLFDKEISQYKGYYKIDLFAESHLHLVQGLAKIVIPFSTYGTTWFAYKHKEQAEGEYGSRVEQAVRELVQKIAVLLLDYTTPCFNLKGESIIEFNPDFYGKIIEFFK